MKSRSKKSIAAIVFTVPCQDGPFGAPMQKKCQKSQELIDAHWLHTQLNIFGSTVKIC
jgi:hypothetical protein